MRFRASRRPVGDTWWPKGTILSVGPQNGLSSSCSSALTCQRHPTWRKESWGKAARDLVEGGPLSAWPSLTLKSLTAFMVLKIITPILSVSS